MNRIRTTLNLNRRLLQADLYTVDSTFSPDTASRNPINGTSTTIKRPFRATPSFEFTMALTVLVLLAVLFFMGFFSVYIRRFTAEGEDPSSSSSSSSDNVHPRRNPPPTSNHSKGLDPSAMKSLPLVPYCVSAEHRMIEDCPICLSEFEETEIVKLIPYCRHVFHPRCIDTWLSSHVNCPVCRSTQLFNRVEVEEVEVYLDVKQEKLDIGMSEIGERSVIIDDTFRDEDIMLVRTRSCPSLANPV